MRIKACLFIASVCSDSPLPRGLGDEYSPSYFAECIAFNVCSPSVHVLHSPKARKLTKDTSEVGDGQLGSPFPVSDSNPR